MLILSSDRSRKSLNVRTIKIHKSSIKLFTSWDIWASGQKSEY